MNALELLRSDHRRIEQMIDDLDGESAGIRTAAEISAQLEMAISVHTQIEEELFYPAVRSATVDAPRLVDDAEDDHRRIRELLEDLGELTDESENYVELVSSLKASVHAHFAREETEIFAEAQRGLDEADLNRLGAELEALKDDLISRPPDERRLDTAAGQPLP